MKTLCSFHSENALSTGAIFYPDTKYDFNVIYFNVNLFYRKSNDIQNAEYVMLNSNAVI